MKINAKRLSIALTCPEGESKSDSQVLKEQLWLAERAETLGFHCAYFFEHHFSSYIISPLPIGLLCYLAARTTRLRLGVSAIVLPLESPIRVAEQMSLLNSLSDGRGIFGLAYGRSQREFDGFGIRFDTRAERFRENLAEIRTWYPNHLNPTKCAASSIEIRPRPSEFGQELLYGAGTKSSQMREFASQGLGVMINFSGDQSQIERLVSEYRSAATEIGLRGKVIVFFCVFVAIESSEAIDNAYEHVLADILAAESHYATKQILGDNAQGSKLSRDEKEEFLQSKGVIVGNPEIFERKINSIISELDLDEVVFEISYGTVPVRSALQTMEHIAGRSPLPTSLV